MRPRLPHLARLGPAFAACLLLWLDTGLGQAGSQMAVSAAELR